MQPSFHSQKLSETSLTAWNALLTEHAKAKTGVSQGHQFLYINSDHEVALFQNKAAAKSAGFQKVSFAKVLEICAEKMKDCTDANALYETTKSLKTLVYKKACQLENESLKAKFNNVFKQKDRSVEIDAVRKLISEMAPTLELMEPQMSERLATELRETYAIVRSRDGEKGVYYLQTSQSHSLILKLPYDPMSHIIADRFYRKFGFTTPRYAAISKETPLGREAHEKVQAEGEKFLQEQLDKVRKSKDYQPGGALESKLTIQLQFLRQHLKHPYVTVMETVEGASFKLTRADDKVTLLQNEDFLESLGRMIFLDAVIGNGDRLSKFTCNTGNFMISESGKLQLIDHDYNLVASSFTRIGQDVTDLLSGSSLETIIGSLLNMIPGEKPGKEKLAPFIQKGIAQAAQQLIDVFKDHAAVYEFLDSPEIKTQETRDPKLFFSILDIVKKQITK